MLVEDLLLLLSLKLYLFTIMPHTTLGSSIPGSALHIPTYPIFFVGVLFPPSFVPVVFVPKEGCLDTSVAVIFEFEYFVHGRLELLFVVFYVLK